MLNQAESFPSGRLNKAVVKAEEGEAGGLVLRRDERCGELKAVGGTERMDPEHSLGHSTN